MTPTPDAQAARELIRQAVSIPSLSGEEQAIAAFLRDWMARRGFDAQVDEAGNAVGVRGSGPLTVALLGHMDTVPGDIPVRVDEAGVLHGRGSVDAKGSLCTFIAAVSALPPEALSAARFVCIGATEEEAPSSKGARYAMRQHRPDFVLIGEPSGWAGLTLGYKGRLVAKVRVEKDNFHTAGDGTSAADDLTLGWQRVREWAAGFAPADSGGGGIFDRVQVTLQDLGSSGDGLTQRAWATIGLRLPPALAPYQAEEAIEQAFAGLGADLTFTGHESAVRHPKDNALTRALRVAIREQGGTPTFKVKTGTSDMNVVAELWPVPTLAYGPGDSALDHTPEERLDLAEYDRAVAVLTSALTRLVGG
ncbi:[LysW]-lysine hydrolase [Deinococcus radiodurans]|uniref:[LysW]-lysine hydrolase n=1 Tax=Deinococcus radiodurans (strain ATCC 13939 / DSM 20539 / JCM 16871 / CCUG 27074 / LMG 4051 / NBRC 15346 / NCIMB 9279 / VKM B-1422 / R1) TaxID=243230 RepID=LYSK_DEIRA|nr:[LysW]-lysine hydrolase [Deinococcus radiodurans]Q9RUH3.1 RecName: Full=[LysW]-lysine hydrolase [Deinococcus radiodurans R1 = ATCC 13939 = DSM 20539]AAF10979.1 succinyl-diaminopimelate desuccinylase, putative [Deinococcus radiodurans R1 = ATCC 13939 = DSM 20539]ANC71443.1 acetyl-lysine deacetylase [Deinococcus radiodurans R1 = ATCC 13939 = DSM 20539]QEM70870.1 [LysW]-lysine hydrolase [Deinococcus radiodurans]UDL00522.1 [LysW]-lysine hydrolase [Deinococcus radiodurans R1 = ATCC 13939 = DSM 2